MSKMTSASVSVLGVFRISKGKQETIPTLNVTCQSCLREFILVKYGDPGWIVNEIAWMHSTIPGMMAIFQREFTFEKFTECITGYAYRNNKKNFDICFKYNKKRGYVSCVKSKTGYNAISVEEIHFG